MVNTDRVGKPESFLRIKVNRIESIVERLAKQQQTQASLDGADTSSISGIEAHLQDLDHLDEHARRSSPLYGLFNNEAITQSDRSAPSLPNTASVISFGHENMSDLQKLQSTISQDPDILDVLEVSKEWWISWRDQAWVLKADGVPQSVTDFVKSRLSSSDPVKYASGLMCIAMAVQQLRPGIDDLDLNLSTNSKALVERITAAVDQIVLTKYLNEDATILIALQRAKIHAEDNQLRKSWLRIRHAILLMKQSDFTDDSDLAREEMMDRQRWIGNVYEMDHFMSMILGFPHALDKNFTDTRAMDVLLGSASDTQLRMRALRRVTALAAGRINERNAALSSDRTSAYTTTQTIQATLTNVASLMPPDWWDFTTHLASPEPQFAFEHLMTQLWFWQIQSFLHLPYMLRYNESTLYQPSRDLCMQGCRNMLRVFSALRSSPAFSVYVCSCEDFQGVLTACMLLMGLLLQMSSGMVAREEDLAEDWRIVEDVKDIFRYRMLQQGGGIARQGLKAVEVLEGFLMREGEDEVVHKGIILPYFGLIKVEVRAGLGKGLQAAKVVDCNAGEVKVAKALGVKPPITPPEEELLRQQPLVGLDSQAVQIEPLTFDFNPTPESDMTMDQNIDWDQWMYGNELASDWGFDALDEYLSTQH